MKGGPAEALKGSEGMGGCREPFPGAGGGSGTSALVALKEPAVPSTGCV